VSSDSVIQRRPRGQGFEDGAQFDLHFEALEGVHALLQALGDRQVPGQDDVTYVRLRRGLADEQQVIVIVRIIDEIEVSPDVVVGDIDAADGTEEALELGKAHHGHRRYRERSAPSRPGPERTNPWSSRPMSPPSQPVHGAMPIKMNSARLDDVPRAGPVFDDSHSLQRRLAVQFPDLSAGHDVHIGEPRNLVDEIAGHVLA
jgi:hypothetical protein